MTAIPFTHEHYPQAREWWTAHGWSPPPVMALPAIGYTVPGQAIGFLYHDPTCSLAVMEYILANPANTPLQSARAIAATVAAPSQPHSRDAHAQERGRVSQQQEKA